MHQTPAPYTVTAITRRIKDSVENSFPDIWVEGEVADYKLHSSGHRYFSLRDENATIRVTLWSSKSSIVKFDLANGLKVLVNGNIAIYEKAGQYQINCKRITPVGIGPLELAFKQLYEKLSSEGLFESARKRTIPSYSRAIGIVTSPTGAAVRDIIQVARRRNNSLALTVYAAKVQGEGAEDTIVAGIQYFNKKGEVDIIIVGRGGGSLEDLWAFNTEKVVRAIAASQIPVVSAVGHEVDFTLADFVADLRCATPSVAAEMTVWSKQETQTYIADCRRRLYRSVTGLRDTLRDNLWDLLQRPVWGRAAEEFVFVRQQYFDSQLRLLLSAGKNLFEGFRNRLSLASSRLDALSPLKILARGYSVTRLESGTIVASIAAVEPGTALETVLEDGRVISIVKATKAEVLHRHS